ncbi:MAG TPA: glycosyltransferase, partial [Lachnospiraceae bacterium]|nr:glycosyltransferase [Lachnospiraceae bacterium]
MKDFEMIDDYAELEEKQKAPLFRDVTAVSLDENMENEFTGQGNNEEIQQPVISQAASRIMASMDKLENRRVLLINTIVGSGSVGRIVSGLYRTLNEHGYECLVAYGRGEAPDSIRSYRIGTDTGVYIHGGLSRITDRHGFFSSKATIELIAVIEEFNPDIVHLHNVHGYYLNVKLLFEYLKRSGRRVIWTLHDCWSFTGHCTHFEYIGCQKWQNGCFQCEQLQEYPKSLMVDNSKKNYQQKKELFTGFSNMTIVTPSEWLEARVKQSYLQKYHTVVIPTGIDLEQFAPVEEERTDDNLVFQLRTRLGIKNKHVLLGVANPWRERKGLSQFESLAKAISDKFVIILIGLNDDQLSSLPHSIIGFSKTES